MTTKVQKKSRVTNNIDLDKAYNALELLKQDQFKNAILKILSDEVMFYRIDNAVFELYNCFAPLERKDADWDGLNKRNGYITALILLGIYDDDILCEKLFEIVYEQGNNSNYNAEMVANVIFQNWTYEITNYFNSKN